MEEIKTLENSFLVEIKYRQNSSWQGTVRWIESGQTQNFKSCLELIRLIDMSFDQISPDAETSETGKIQ